MSSLFPAYSDDAGGHEVHKTNAQNEDGPSTDWLTNASFVSTHADKLQHLHVHVGSKKFTNDEKTDLETKPSGTAQDKDRKRYQFIKEYHSSSEDSHTEDIQCGKSSKKLKLLSSNSSEDDDHKDKKHHHHKKKKKKSKKHKHKDKKDGKSSKTRKEDGLQSEFSALVRQNGKIFLEDLGETNIEHPFYMDKSPDASNYTYQSIYKAHIASYMHMANLGLGSGAADINKKLNKKNKKKEFDRYFGSKRRKANVEEDDDIPFTEPQSLICDHEESARTKPVLEDFMTLSQTQSSKVQFREKSDIISVSSCQQKNTALQKQEEYNKKLRQNPNNINLWLEFISFQDEFCPDAGELGLYDTSKGIAKSKKLEGVIFHTKEAIFERALKENPFSPSLKLAQLACVKNFWDSEALHKEWKELLGRNLNNLDVWRKYFDYIESKSVSFTVTSLLKAYKKCLVAVNKSTETGLDATDFLIDVFTRLCYRLSQSGQNEKASALFQAQVEYNMFSPDDPGLAKSELMEYFVAFWESSAPRIGEEGALGWNNWMKNHGRVQPFVPFQLKEDDDSLEQDILQKSGDKHVKWHTLEALRSSRHWLPWRPDGDGSYDDCDDLERLVVSDDLTFALFTANSPLQKLKLLRSFLEFLGVPCVENYANFSQIASTDNLAPVTLQMTSQLFGCLSHEQHKTICNKRYPSLVNCEKLIANIFHQTLPLFKHSEATCTKMTLMYVDFLEWRLSTAHLELSRADYKVKVKETRGAMKKLLYEEPYRTSVLAWLRYAMLEWHLGRPDDASKTFYHTVTSLAQSGSASNTYRHCMEYFLYRTYAEMELGFFHFRSLVGKELKHDPSKTQKALQILVSICEGSLSTPADTFSITTSQLLRCRKHYDKIQVELMGKLCESDTPTEEELYVIDTMGCSLEHWVASHKMFTYVTSGLRAVVEIHDKLIRSLCDVSEQSTEKSRRSMITGIKQRLLEAHITLLQLHLTRGCVPLRTVQLPTADALREFPSNPSILWSYIQLELKSSFTGNMRRYLARDCRKTNSPLVWTFSIIAQLLRLEKLLLVNQQAMAYVAMVPEASVSVPETGFVHTMRTWFQWATSSEVCEHYLLIWRLYLKFEIEHGKPDITKRVFYEAIQHCPWAKCLYLDYISAYPDSTQEVVDLMTEREIRIHLPLEELDILLEEMLT